MRSYLRGPLRNIAPIELSDRAATDEGERPVCFLSDHLDDVPHSGFPSGSQPV